MQNSPNTAILPSQLPSIPLPAIPPLVPGFGITGQTFLPLPAVVPPSNLAPATAPPAVLPEWTEHKAPDGQVYYYNTITKQSSWTKPDQLKTQAELLFSLSPWKEYTSDSGKIYYHNIQTKESRWTIPVELEELKNRIRDQEEGKKIEVNSTIKLSPKSKTGDEPKSALESAMAATLAAIETPNSAEILSKDVHKIKMEEKEHVTKSNAKQLPMFKDKKEMIEGFKDLLKEYNISTNATWEQCMKQMQNDPRFEVFKNFSEKKQAFNAYKTQKLKDEKEEQRLKMKRAKERLEEFLLKTEMITSTTKYYKCDELFANNDVWTSVPDTDRRDIFSDAMIALAQREKEEVKVLKKRNIKKLAEVLDNMDEIKYCTTWAEAQKMLLNNSLFKNDLHLLAMEKEDALIVFSEHIRNLENEHVEEKEREKKIFKRQCRKNRDNFLELIDKLYADGKIKTNTTWLEFFPLIVNDIRFTALLGQPGSMPLDLFKFFIEDLKVRYHNAKKLIKEIMRDKNLDIELKTTFDEFASLILEDSRADNFDEKIMKQVFEALMEKIQLKEKDRIKEETKKIKKLESNFKNMLQDLNIDFELPWMEIRHKIDNEDEFLAIGNEEDRIRIYKNFQHDMEETCTHHHPKSKKSKKKKNKKRKSKSSSDSHSDSEGSIVNGHNKKKKKKKHKKRSDSSVTSEEHSLKKKSKKSKLKIKSEVDGRISESEISEKTELSERELEERRAQLLAQLKEPELSE